MKKISLLLSIFTLSILFPLVSSAQTTTSRIDVLKQKIIEQRQEALNQIQASTTKKLDERKGKILNSFEKTINNLKDLALRIESRLVKIESNGLNVSKSKILLEKAVSNINLAEIELTNLKNILVQDIPTSTSTKITERVAILKSIKTQSEKTKTAIKVAHKSLIDVVTSIKSGLLKERKATTTKQTISTSTSN